MEHQWSADLILNGAFRFLHIRFNCHLYRTGKPLHDLRRACKAASPRLHLLRMQALAAGRAQFAPAEKLLFDIRRTSKAARRRLHLLRLQDLAVVPVQAPPPVEQAIYAGVAVGTCRSYLKGGRNRREEMRREDRRVAAVMVMSSCAAATLTLGRGRSATAIAEADPIRARLRVSLGLSQVEAVDASGLA